jgi:hypothetical protein
LNAVFLGERLSETWDRYLLERKSDVECEMLVEGEVGHDRLPYDRPVYRSASN